MTFGSKLQQLRKAKGLSQEELADTLRVSRQSVSRWENDQGYPEMEKLVQISSVFSATTDFLLKEPSDNEEGERLYPGYYVSRETAEGFLLFRERRSRMRAAGTSLSTLAFLPFFLFIGNDIAAVLPCLVLLAAAVCIFLTDNLRNNPYKALNNQLLSFQPAFLEELKSTFQIMQKKYLLMTLAGTLSLFLGIIYMILADELFSQSHF